MLPSLFEKNNKNKINVAQGISYGKSGTECQILKLGDDVTEVNSNSATSVFSVPLFRY